MKDTRDRGVSPVVTALVVFSIYSASAFISSCQARLRAVESAAGLPAPRDYESDDSAPTFPFWRPWRYTDWKSEYVDWALGCRRPIATQPREDYAD